MAVLNYEFFDYKSSPESQLLDLKENKMKFYVNMQGETVGTLYIRKKPWERRKIPQDGKVAQIRKILNKSYEQALQSGVSMLKGKSGKQSKRDILVSNITDSLIDNSPEYDLKQRLKAKRAEVEQFIHSFFDDCAHNVHNREKRFQRKAMYNMMKYSHFITITYDPENFSDEETFRKTLKNWFGHSHDRKGSFVQGVFERGGANGRLHFHGLMYVPEGFFKDGLVERKVYSTEEQKWTVIHENPTLRRKFGQNDFSQINPYNIVDRINYICKYIGKSGERFFYNRGIKGEALAFADIKKINFFSDEYVRHYLFDEDVVAYALPERSPVEFYTDISDVVFPEYEFRETT